MRAVSLAALIVFILCLTARSAAQVKSEVTVTRSETTSNGVVFVYAKQAENSIELQCNAGMVHCNRLQAGTYVMIEMPKNRGIYDCADVRLYRNAEDVDAGNQAGEYCLERK